MTPHHKCKNVKLTSITRLRWYRDNEFRTRIPMVGDAAARAGSKNWDDATKAIYRASVQFMIELINALRYLDRDDWVWLAAIIVWTIVLLFYAAVISGSL
jgi:hypothetical protein